MYKKMIYNNAKPEIMMNTSNSIRLTALISFFYLLATTTIPANAGIVEAMKREKSITQAKQITSEVKIALSSGSTQTITETLNKLKQTPQIQDDEKKYYKGWVQELEYSFSFSNSLESDMLFRFIEKGLPLDDKDDAGYNIGTALLSHLIVCEKGMNKENDPNKKAYYVSRYNVIKKIISKIVQFNIDFSESNEVGKSRLIEAIQMETPNAALFIASLKGAKLEETSDGLTTLMWAVESNMPDIVALVGPHSHLEAKDKQGITALIRSILRKHTTCTEKLLKIGANPNTKYKDFPPLHYAVDIKDPRTIQMLLKFGADATVRDDINIYTPLHYAVLLNDANLVNAFINANAPLNSIGYFRYKNKYDKLAVAEVTPLDLAMIKQYKNIEKILVAANARMKFMEPTYYDTGNSKLTDSDLKTMVKEYEKTHKFEIKHNSSYWGSRSAKDFGNSSSSVIVTPR